MPSQTRTTVFLISLGTLLCGLLLYQTTAIARDDFYVAHHFGGLLPRLKILAYFFSGFLIACWAVLRSIKEYPVKKFLAIILVTAAVAGSIAVVTHPTRSQDLYWSLLLGKASSHSQLNPYQTLPQTLGADPWAYPVLTWKDIPMIYGPLWTWIVAGTTRFTDSLAVALITTKLLFVGLWALSGFIFWKITAELGYDALKRAKYLLFFFWNPFIIQIALVDGHNDILLMLVFLASYYLLLKKNYMASMLVLIAGGAIKYTPLLFLLIPAWYLWQEKNLGVRRYYQLAVVGIFGIAAAVGLFLPFGGLSWKNFAGLSSQLDRIGLPAVQLPGTRFILGLFQFNYAQLHLLGFALVLALIVLCLKYKKPLLAYSLPLVGLFFFATPWFQPWYMIWILPLLMLSWPATAMVGISIFLMLTPELYTPATLSMSLPAYAFYAWGLKTVWEQIKTSS